MCSAERSDIGAAVAYTGVKPVLRARATLALDPCVAAEAEWLQPAEWQTSQALTHWVLTVF